MERLNNAYNRIKKIIGKYTEPMASVQLVETYRRYWKPKNVRIILLAESHVYTRDEDRSVSLSSIPDLPDYPTKYARFVYCLGYGERDLTDNGKQTTGGTPQFWKIFFSCNKPVSCLDDFSPILKRTPREKRIMNKIRLLKELKAKGIWLIDASIVALYKDKKKIPYMFDALEESWKLYTRDIVLSAKPEHIICIGKGVARIVEGDLSKHFNDRYTVVAQPNARLGSKEHLANFKTYSRICCSHHPIHDKSAPERTS